MKQKRLSERVLRRFHFGSAFMDTLAMIRKVGLKPVIELIKKMAEDLNDLNVSGSMTCAPEILERTWSKNMCWFGPCGIGASYTIL